MTSRPIESTSFQTITSALPTDNPGYHIQPTGGAPCVAYKCTDATGTPVVKAYVRESSNGDWELWDSYQLPVTTAMASATLRTANTSITLTADDTIFVLAAGFYAVALVLQSGTSATLTARTCEVPADLPATVTATVSGIATEAKQDTQITSLQLLDDAVFTDDAAFTPGTSKGLAVGFQADETSTDSVDEGDFGVPRMTLDRKQIVTPEAHTNGGSTVYKTLDLDESEEDVKTSAGQVYGFMFYNAHASSARYLKFYNAAAASVTVGTTTPVATFPLKAGEWTGIVFPVGWALDTAICIAATTGLADNDTGAPGANEVIGAVFYK